jgi:hypothetical protein
LNGFVDVACVAARYFRTPAAIAGFIHRHDNAVMIPSRPNGVLNQGTPA